MTWLNSTVADWRKFHTLTRAEKWLLVVSMLLLPVVVEIHRAFGLRRAQCALKRFLPGRANASYPMRESVRHAQSLSRIVQIAANRTPWNTTCLQQSVYLHWTLTRRGIDSHLRIGVRRRSGVFEAHAWVECLGHAINESKNVEVRFSPFPRGINNPMVSRR